MFQWLRRILSPREWADSAASAGQHLHSWILGDGAKTAVSVGYVAGAVIVGFVSVWIEKLLSWTFKWTETWYTKSPELALVICPLLFLTASILITKFAPYAGGSGIPQVLKATELSVQGTHHNDFKPLVSVRGSLIKTISVTLGILGGASIGREGPTVQISASIFHLIGRGLSRAGARLTFHSFLVCGASAGIAAAFNTPLAGITFALEELAGSIFSRIRQVIILAIIVAGLVARSLAGNYLYFERTSVQVSGDILITLKSIGIGMVCGLVGAVFVWSILTGRKSILAMTPIQRLIIVPIAAGLIVGTLALLTGGHTLGTGYQAASNMLSGGSSDWTLTQMILFPFAKLAATVLSFLSGMAGGIFSPSLSIGAAVGNMVAQIFDPPSMSVLSLLGMAAFLAAVTQAPLTAFIIVMEMTAEHALIIPLMACTLVATAVVKLLGFKPIYHSLALLIRLPNEELHGSSESIQPSSDRSQDSPPVTHQN